MRLLPRRAMGMNVKDARVHAMAGGLPNRAIAVPMSTERNKG